MRCHPEVYVMSAHVNAWTTAPVKGTATLNTFNGLSELLTSLWKPVKINRDCILELQSLRTFQSEPTEALTGTSCNEDFEIFEYWDSIGLFPPQSLGKFQGGGVERSRRCCFQCSDECICGKLMTAYEPVPPVLVFLCFKFPAFVQSVRRVVLQTSLAWKLQCMVRPYWVEWHHLLWSVQYCFLCCRLHLPSKGCRPKVGWSLSLRIHLEIFGVWTQVSKLQLLETPVQSLQFEAMALHLFEKMEDYKARTLHRSPLRFCALLSNSEHLL